MPWSTIIVTGTAPLLVGIPTVIASVGVPGIIRLIRSAAVGAAVITSTLAAIPRSDGAAAVTVITSGAFTEGQALPALMLAKRNGHDDKSPLRHNVNGLTVTAAASEEMRQVRREGKHVVRPVVKPSFKFSPLSFSPDLALWTCVRLSPKKH